MKIGELVDVLDAFSTEMKVTIDGKRVSEVVYNCDAKSIDIRTTKRLSPPISHISEIDEIPYLPIQEEMESWL